MPWEGANMTDGSARGEAFTDTRPSLPSASLPSPSLPSPSLPSPSLPSSSLPSHSLPGDGPAPARRERVVHEEIELDIVLGRLKPGERLTEDAFMARFEAKRHVVRTAFGRLERAGLVVRQRNKGAMVREYGPDEVEELYAMRADLHRLAVERMALPFATETLSALTALAARHEAAMGKGDLVEVILCNDAFHDRLFDQCGNRFLSGTIRQLAAASHPIRSYRIADPGLLAQAAREHREMVEAARGGDRQRLADLCELHIQPSRRLYEQDLRQHLADDAGPPRPA